MAQDTFHYPDTDRNLLYSAVLKSVAELGFKLKFSDRAGGVISCDSKWSMKSFGQQINLTIATGSPGAVLTISTFSGQAFDWGEGKSIIQSLKNAVDKQFEATVDTPVTAPPPATQALTKDLADEHRAQAQSLRETGIIRQKDHRTDIFRISLFGVVAGFVLMYFQPQNVKALWLLGLGFGGLAVWYVWGMFMPKQCVRCSKHTVNCLSSVDTLVGVRTEQRSVTNLNTRQTEWARVTVSDMENRSKYRCTSCKHEWTETNYYKKDGG
ncbi:hypothetical protein DKY63_29025 [Pseudomonas putida]|uniref:Uncharacterized protein n=1 Tax=Pseudomonas putida TaxID=303 RepID=A0A2Z4RV70_PSEPU|nr:hypothetical protein [Pseudomonas putida]AWY43744.1 hypothetical protein DKY63_29025 [Pseudomonas putida]